MITIYSGGQTGVDRAALDAAISAKIPHGGWCPQGRIAEDGVIPSHYQLSEVPLNTDISDDIFAQRTLLNIISSDVTCVAVMDAAAIHQINDGTLLTISILTQRKIPWVLIDLKDDAEKNSRVLKEFLSGYKVSVLNIAGPRESNFPGIYQKAFDFFIKYFKDELDCSASTR